MQRIRDNMYKLIVLTIIIAIFVSTRAVFAQPPIEPLYGDVVFFKIPEGKGEFLQITAFNNQGQVAGTTFESIGDNYLVNKAPFTWSVEDGWKDLEIPEETDFFAVAEINNTGKAVGYYLMGPPPGPIQESKAVLWTSDGAMTDLSEIVGGDMSWAEDINDNDQVVGYTVSSTGTVMIPHAFLWSEESGVINIAFSESGNIANSINDLGDVVGTGPSESGEMHAFIWSLETGMEDLGFFGEKNTFNTMRINNLKQILGWSANMECSEIGCLITDKSYFFWTEEIGTLWIENPEKDFCNVNKFNNLGEVVCWCANETEEGNLMDPEAFFWTADGGMENLQEKIGLDVSFTDGINDLRQIAGTIHHCEMIPDPPFFDCFQYIYLWSPPEVQIDIRPSRINNNSNSMIPGTIFGSPEFNVEDIDPESLRLESLMRIKTVRDDPLIIIKDFNRDGCKDLMVIFEMVKGIFSKSDTKAILTGSLYDGKLFYGTDSVSIIL